MDGQLAAPFHFAAEFLILAVCAGAAADALRGFGRGSGRWALVRCVGFATLVAAQIAHGALLVEGDGEIAVVVMRAIGFGLLALSLKPMPITGMPAIFFAGGDARWAALPAFFAIVASVRLLFGQRDERDQGSLSLAGSFALFAAGEAALAAAAETGGVGLVVSHAARSAGALLLARWLWTSFTRSVRLRFVAVFVAALVLLATVVAGALTQVIGGNLEDAELRRLETVASGQASALQERVEQATLVSNTLADLFIRSQTDFDAVLAPGAAAQLFRTGRALLPFDADFLAFLDNNGQVRSSAREVPTSGSQPNIKELTSVEQFALAGSSVVQQAIGVRPTAAGDMISIELDQIAAVGAAPAVGARGRQLLGAVIVGFDLDRAMLLNLGRGAEAELTVLKGGEVISTTYDDQGHAAGLISGPLRNEVRRTVEETGQFLHAFSSPSGERSFTVYAPITAQEGTQVVGVLVVSRPAVLLADAQRTINRTLFLIVLGASALAAAFAWVLSGRVTRPIRALTRAARKVRGGDLDVRATVDLPDEVGTLGEAFNEMAQSLKNMTDDLRGAADEEANLRARMEAIMQSMGDALVATDTGGSIVAFNRAAETMFGRDADDVVGRRLSEVITGVDANGHALADAVLGGNGAGITATIESATGRNVPVAITGAPLRDAAGETVGRVVVLRDTSREHEAERMKSEFLANVSHELRTPLTPIKGYTEILRRKQFPRKKAQTFLDGIMDSTKRLERIVEILVDFAAIEAGRLKPRLEPIDVRDLLTTTLDGWKDRGRGHRFVRRVPAGLPPVLGDERLLRKCLDELLDNAIKFSPKGGDIEIEAEPAVAPGKRRASAVRILVRDHGIGIEPSHMTNLFQDFRQGDGSETRTYGGLGLGLSYARRVALAHRGDITATSRGEDHGSTFALTLPVAPAAVRPVGRANEPKQKSRPRTTKPGVIRKKVAAAKVPPRRRGSR